MSFRNLTGAVIAIAFFATSASAVDLPSLRAQKTKGQEQGWIFATEVRESDIPGAGNGRFAGEILQDGSEAFRKPVIAWVDGCDTLSFPPNVTLLFDSRAAIESFIAILASQGHSEEIILDLIANFCWSFDGQNLYLNWATWTVNHSSKPNLAVSFEDGVFVGRACGDIESGKELLMNYHDFAMPAFYEDFAQEKGFRHVRDAVTSR